MEKRICPKCGTENYSEDTRNDWNCVKCRGIVKPSDKVDIDFSKE
jgi:predicted nucleic-acid-binding Zn-ribbon protein